MNQLLEKTIIPSHFVSADAVGFVGNTWLEQQWEAARLKMEQSGAREFLLIIDEIQKLKNWSETVKLLWDTDTQNKKQLKVWRLPRIRGYDHGRSKMEKLYTAFSY